MVMTNSYRKIINIRAILGEDFFHGKIFFILWIKFVFEKYRNIRKDSDQNFYRVANLFPVRIILQIIRRPAVLFLRMPM